METVAIRQSGPTDIERLEELYPSVFPEEDLRPLVRALLQEASGVLSLVAIAGGGVIGHIAFTDCRLPDDAVRPALLGPLAVATRVQRRGVGGALVQGGLAQLAATGASHVFVLGDPAYYARFGFEEETRVEPPYQLPAAWRGAWRSKRLDESAPDARGRLTPPPPWRAPSLWAP